MGEAFRQRRCCLERPSPLVGAFCAFAPPGKYASCRMCLIWHWRAERTQGILSGKFVATAFHSFLCDVHKDLFPVRDVRARGSLSGWETTFFASFFAICAEDNGGQINLPFGFSLTGGISPCRPRRTCRRRLDLVSCSTSP